MRGYYESIHIIRHIDYYVYNIIYDIASKFGVYKMNKENIRPISYEQAIKMSKLSCHELGEMDDEMLNNWIKEGYVLPKKLTAKEEFLNYKALYLGNIDGKECVWIDSFDMVRHYGKKAIEEAENKNKLSQESIDYLKWLSGLGRYKKISQILKELGIE